MADTQPIQGPDGQLYQFPEGTSKDAAIAYFKKKGIGGKPAPAAAPPSSAPEMVTRGQQILGGFKAIGSALSKPALQADIGKADAAAQEHVNQYAGPEAKKNSTLQKVGHGFAAYGEETRKVFDKVALGLMDWKTAVAVVAQKVDPAIAAAYFATEGTKAAYDSAKMGKWSPDNVQNFLLGLSTAAAAGTAAASPKAGAVVEGVKSAPDLIHKGAQIAAGVGPERTTGRMAEEYKADLDKAHTRQTEENESTEAANRRTTEDAFNEAGKRQAKHNQLVEQEAKTTDAKNREAIEKHADQRRDVVRQNEEQQAEHTLASQDVQERNSAAMEIQTRRGALARGVKQGSKVLGEQVKDLDSKVRKIGDKKYDAIRSRLEADPGVQPEQLGTEMKAAVDKYVKGVPETIKQVQDVLRRGETQESVMINGRELTPQTDPSAWANLIQQGIVEGAGNPIKFSDLQGYSTELGSKLASGKLPGDVYQAVKAVKEIIDREKTTIAERNGLGDELRDADAFWRQYMETFYDKPSAVAAVRERVGKLDPDFYADPFINGKAAQTGIGKLEAMAKSVPELQSDFTTAASLAKTLREQHQEFKSLPAKAKLSEPPKPPAPVDMPAKPELKQPKQIAKPEPVEVEYKTPKQVKQPERPTVEDVKARKEQELHYAAREIGRLSKYDAAIIASSAVGPFFGRWETMLIDPAYIVGRKAIGAAIERPKVIEWLSRPRPEDIAVLEKLPGEAREEIGNNLKNFISEEEAHGRKVSVSSEVKRVLLSAPKGKGLVDKGKEILSSK